MQAELVTYADTQDTAYTLDDMGYRRDSLGKGLRFVPDDFIIDVRHCPGFLIVDCADGKPRVVCRGYTKRVPCIKVRGNTLYLLRKQLSVRGDDD
jgi:hypothetical protein